MFNYYWDQPWDAGNYQLLLAEKIHIVHPDLKNIIIVNTFLKNVCRAQNDCVVYVWC